MYLKVLDKSFPLAYTVEAQTEIAERAGGLEKLDELFDNENAAESTERTVWMAAVMMRAAANREKLKCRMLGEEYKGGEPPTCEELRILLNVGEIGEVLMKEISEAMAEGQESTVEVKEDTKKNGTATQ